MSIEKAFEKLSGPKMIIALVISTVALTFYTINWFNTSFVSKQMYDSYIKQIEKNQQDSRKNLDTQFNKLRQEIKQVRVEELLFKQKLLLSKGEANLTDFDKTTLQLIELELRTFNVTPQ